MPVTDAEDCLALLRQGSKRLAFVATEMNAHSSRSHAICQLLVIKDRDGLKGGQAAALHRHKKSVEKLAEDVGEVSKGVRSPRSPHKPEHIAMLRKRSVEVISTLIESKMQAHQSTRAKMTLCDLAGSEDVGRSGATGVALAEAKKINTSLLALGNAIQALTTSTKGSKGHMHVPFRDSVLTRMLQESLGGNCKTTLLCCCSPAEADTAETLSTLRFGGRAKLVQQHAKINATVDMGALAEQLACEEEIHSEMSASEALLLAARIELEHAHAIELERLEVLEVQPYSFCVCHSGITFRRSQHHGSPSSHRTALSLSALGRSRCSRKRWARSRRSWIARCANRLWRPTWCARSRKRVRRRRPSSARCDPIWRRGDLISTRRDLSWRRAARAVWSWNDRRRLYARIVNWI